MVEYKLTEARNSVPILRIDGVTAGYGDVAAIRDIDITVCAGQVIALLGPNGAGKTTTLLAAAGVLPCRQGMILWDGRAARRLLHQRARAGLAFVPEERGVIRALTVRENLELGRGGVEPTLEHFPELRPLLDRPAGLLSGGEQQMLVVGRALASRPRVLLVDELSLGLAPLIVERLLAALRGAADNLNMGVIVVEQQARLALETADRWYLFNRGEVTASGDNTVAYEEFEAIYMEHMLGGAQTASP